MLAFSPTGDKLLSVGEDDQHSVAVYDWATNRMIASAKVDPDKIFDGIWKDDKEFALVGLKCVKFFTIQGTSLTPRKGLYGKLPVTPMLCGQYAFASKTFICGTATGDLAIWNGNQLGKLQKAHTGPLWAIISTAKNTMAVTGANDAKVIFWD